MYIEKIGMERKVIGEPEGGDKGKRKACTVPHRLCRSIWHGPLGSTPPTPPTAL